MAIEPNSHRRVQIKNINPSPKNAVFLTKEDYRQQNIIIALLFSLLAMVTLFPRKK